MKNPTIYNLRKEMKFKCRLTHKRYLKSGELMSMYDIRQKKLQNLIHPMGGFSYLEVTTPKGNNYTISSYCNKKDSFNHKIALNILVGRLMKEIAP